MDEMDALEQMAWDLEDAQNKRYNSAKELTDKQFWDNPNEFTIFQTIKTFREKSRTYNPDNYR